VRSPAPPMLSQRCWPDGTARVRAPRHDLIEFAGQGNKSQKLRVPGGVKSGIQDHDFEFRNCLPLGKASLFSVARTPLGSNSISKLAPFEPNKDHRSILRPVSGLHAAANLRLCHAHPIKPSVPTPSSDKVEGSGTGAAKYFPPR